MSSLEGEAAAAPDAAAEEKSSAFFKHKNAIWVIPWSPLTTTFDVGGPLYLERILKKTILYENNMDILSLIQRKMTARKVHSKMR